MKVGGIIYILCSVIVLTICGVNIYNNYSVESLVSEETESLIRPNDIKYFKTKCLTENMTISDVMYCSEGYIKKIYKYNITDDNIELSYYELITKGGDCKDWAEFWMELGEMYNYTVRKEVVPVSDKVNHAIALISNEEGYCFAGNNHIDCYEYKRGAGVE